MRELPEIGELRRVLDYDPETGELTFKRRSEARGSWNARCAGKPALHTLSPLDGYKRGRLFGKMTLAHRVAFALHTGRTTFEFIDHINGDRTDNRAINLREVSRVENAKNKARPSNSSTGHIGVSRTPEGRFRAHITVDDQTLHLGRFATLDEAIEARRAAEARFGFHPNHGRSLETAKETNRWT